MWRRVKNTIIEIVIGAALGVVGMGSLLWVGLGMHFPKGPETVEAASVEEAEPERLPELMSVDRMEIRDLRAGAGEDEEAALVDPYEDEMAAYGYSESDLELLAAIVYAEAGDQDFVGQRLVADVVLNRVASPAWPSTISEVVYQPGQFSPVTDGGLDRAWGRVTESCYEAVRLALAGERIDTQVIYFSMYGCANGEFAFQHGDHYFGY